jgi:hypothetical protein
MRCMGTLLLVALAARPALGQSEDALRAAFEGKTVRVAIEMPGSDDGVDVYPGTAQPLDLSKHAGRLKEFGAAYRPGDMALVTKVHVKGDHIEFQLGGGGFGTMGDNTSTTVVAPVAVKTQREKDLEKQIKTVTDPDQKKRMRDEMDKLRGDREREDARNATRAAQAQAIKEATLRQKRLDGGSRFNIRYNHDVPASALVPDAVIAALAGYVDFSGGPPANAAQAVGVDALKKGMSQEDVDALLGRPESITQRAEGTLQVSTSVYRSGDRKVTADFVEGVLVRFAVGAR